MFNYLKHFPYVLLLLFEFVKLLLSIFCILVERNTRGGRLLMKIGCLYLHCKQTFKGNPRRFVILKFKTKS